MSEQIDQFFNPDGTLISIPVKSAKKIAVLLHIARDLSPTTKYPEKELNAIIAKYHDDTAAIRRHMIEYGILERDAETHHATWKHSDLVPGCPELRIDKISDLFTVVLISRSTDLMVVIHMSTLSLFREIGKSAYKASFWTQIAILFFIHLFILYQ